LQLPATITKLIMSISSCSLWSTWKLVVRVFYSKLIPPPTKTTTTTTTSWWSACQVQHIMFSFLSSTPLHDQPGCCGSCCCCYTSCCFATNTWILSRLKNLISQYCKLLLLTLDSAPDHIAINSDHALTAWSIIIIIIITTTTTTTTTTSSSCSTAWARHSQLQELCNGYTHAPGAR
jgi:hypothetical protein